MPMLDIFESDAFSTVSLTAAINRLKPQFGMIGDMGLFREQGVSTTTVAIEDQGDVLNLLSTVERGGPSIQNTTGKRKVYQVLIPHNPLEDVVLPSDVQDLRAFGQEMGLEMVEDKVLFKLASMRRKHEITKEWRRAKALEGTIVDADGSTVLLNLYTLLGKSRKEVDFKLGTTTTKVTNKITEAKRHIEDNSEGEIITDYVGLASPTFMDKLVSHSKVEAAHANWEGRSNLLGADLRAGFRFGGVLWREYSGAANNVDAAGSVTSRKFITDGDALIVPMGTMDTFLAVNGPGDMNEAVNTVGLPFYASSEPRKHGKGVELYTESNFMPYVTRPQLVVRCHSSD